MKSVTYLVTFQFQQSKFEEFVLLPQVGQFGHGPVEILSRAGGGQDGGVPAFQRGLQLLSKFAYLQQQQPKTFIDFPSFK